MKELIASVVGLGILLYLMRNERAPVLKKPRREGFELEILQNTLNQIQKKEADIYPVDTVYFNKNSSSDGSGYSGRFMFFNTKHFYNVQYDVETNSDGTVLTSFKKMIPPDYKAPFSGVSTKFTYSGITNVSPPKINMSKIWENYKVENIK